MTKINVRVYFEDDSIEFQIMHAESCVFINYIDPIVRELGKPFRRIEITKKKTYEERLL